MDAKQALEELKAGNQRFVTGISNSDNNNLLQTRAKLTEAQEPFAVILGCADSRVPAELIFDQALGDLFVIRIAGNIVLPSQLGSVEFAVHKLKTPLVVVLGHEDCGAVRATIDMLDNPDEELTENLCSIVDEVRPSVEPLLDSPLKDHPEQLLSACIHANTLHSYNKLLSESPLLKQYVDSGQLTITAADYSLDTGMVKFFEST